MSESLRLPVTVTPKRIGTTGVVLVGAGGIGARIAPALIKLLARDDALLIIDPDMVEERNLIRQHFVGSDVGRPKAEVVAGRLQREAERLDVTVTPLVEAFRADLWPSISRMVGASPLIISGVDSRRARIALNTTIALGQQVAWVDAGNSMWSGQVALQLTRWPVTAVHDGQRQLWRAREGTWREANLHTMQEQYADLLDEAQEEAEATPGCALRPDLQTVNANNMAATAAVNVATWLLDERPFSSGGCRFTLEGPSMTSTPIWRAEAYGSAFRLSTRQEA